MYGRPQNCRQQSYISKPGALIGDPYEDMPVNNLKNVSIDLRLRQIHDSEAVISKEYWLFPQIY